MSRSLTRAVRSLYPSAITLAVTILGAMEDNLCGHFSLVRRRPPGMLVDCGLPSDSFNQIAREDVAHRSPSSWTMIPSRRGSPGAWKPWSTATVTWATPETSTGTVRV